MVGPSGGVDLLSVEPLGEKAEEARGEGNDLSDGSAREVLSPCQFAWRHRPEIQLEAKALRDGRRRPDNSDFFMSISLRGALSHQAHDCFVQLIGVAALQLIGASLKREVPKRSPLVQQLAEAVFHQGRRPQKWLMHPRLLPSTPPAETAMSTCRSHHCPGLHYALWHVANCTNTLHQLPKALVCLAGRGAHAKRAIQFQLLGWCAAHLQHDVAEFIDFFLPRTTAAGGHAWCSRTQRREGICDQLTGPLNKCRSLPAPPLHRPYITPDPNQPMAPTRIPACTVWLSALGFRSASPLCS